MSKKGEVLKVGEAECRAMLLSCGDASADRCNLFFLQRKVVKLCDNQGLGEPSGEYEELYERVVTHARAKGEIHVLPDAPGKVKVPKEVPDAAEAREAEKAKERKEKEKAKSRERKKEAGAKEKVEDKQRPQEKPVRAEKAPAAGKKVSDLDAAYQVLLGSKEPLPVRELVSRIEEEKLWAPGPKCTTPMTLTLKAHLYQDMKQKGADSRFKLEGKGLFAARKGS